MDLSFIRRVPTVEYPMPHHPYPISIYRPKLLWKIFDLIFHLHQPLVRTIFSQLKLVCVAVKAFIFWIQLDIEVLIMALMVKGKVLMCDEAATNYPFSNDRPVMR